MTDSRSGGRGARSSRHLRDDRGSATAETAIVLPVVVLMLAVLALMGVGVVQEVRLESAARAAARELARGEDEAAALEAARHAGGEGAQVQVIRAEPWVTVHVVRTLHPVRSGPLSGAVITLRAHAVARLEPQLLEGGP